jgi:hypothetical protein
MRYLDSLPWALVALACLTLGLAPFSPEPHLWEKLQLLSSGELKKSIDIFDLLLHGAPWLVLLAKLGALLRPRRS